MEAKEAEFVEDYGREKNICKEADQSSQTVAIAR
jgi:hypothetical protein